MRSPGDHVAHIGELGLEVTADLDALAGGSRPCWRRRPSRRRRPRSARSVTMRTGCPIGPVKPTGELKCSSISSSPAWRNGRPSAFWSLISLSVWSPRSSTSSGVPSSSSIIGIALSSVLGIDVQRRRPPARSSSARACETSSGASSSGPATAGAGVALAISTLAA